MDTRGEPSASSAALSDAPHLSGFGLKARPKTAAPETAPSASRQNWGRGFGLTPATDRPKSKRQSRKDAYNALPEACSGEDILWREINLILGKEYCEQALREETDRQSPFEYHQELELEVVAISSTGAALATSSESSRPWVVVVPFALPGETIRARVFRDGRLYSAADLLEVVKPNPELRDDSLVQCKYFKSCAGCQYQMSPYEKQLEFKRDVVVKAFKNYAEMPETDIPPIGPTMPSPLQYNYRTKLTPHFEAPSKRKMLERADYEGTDERPEWFNIGFNRVGTHSVMDIEDCPIATPIIRETLPIVRANAIKNCFTYKKGVSLILRDSLPPRSDGTDPEVKHVCITDHRATARERVGLHLFEYPNSSFFQNNNSVLPSLATYIESRIFDPVAPGPRPTHLVDAYCGAGLFAISLAANFQTVVGIELSAESIRAARHNAFALNEISPGKLEFEAGDAAEIFRTVNGFPAEETCVIIDPPRKGCDWAFLRQLLAFKPRTIVYVSCNVHTQARDVGMIVNRGGFGVGGLYALESLRGFDLFPQTAHVESVAVLRLVG
ncbi:tRNA methyltransferase [Mycena filopes]|nr:tRNA methyltransferase [Mycena filopes]